MTNSLEKKLTDLIPGSGQGTCFVFSLSDLSDFSAVLPPFTAYAQSRGKKIVRIRFVPDADSTSTQPGIPQSQSQDGFWEISVPLNHRFRHFTVAVHEQIRQTEPGSLFLFDCLSELQTAWATDLMMVNFFTVTTPLLRSRGDIALFP